jgi:predicted GIY-YIG superfamily endonuclease
MVTVYVLRSLKDGAKYTGMALDVSKRLNEHNAGKNRYTKGHRPWEVVYTEVHPDWKSARIREKYLKSAAGRN